MNYAKFSVDYRIKKLVREGVISKFGVLIDETRLGFSLAQVLLKIRITNKAEEKRVVSELADNPFTVWVVRCGGEYNFALEVYARDLSHLDHTLNELSKKIGSALLSLASFLVSYQYKYSYGVGPLIDGLDQKCEKQEFQYPSKVFPISDPEKSLLAALERDGRATSVKLGEEVGLDQDTVVYHLKKLMKSKILLGVSPHINLLGLGFQKYIVIVRLKNVSMPSNPMKGFIQSNPFIRYGVRHVGTMQLYLLVFADSTGHFYKILEEMEFSFPDIIDSIDFYPVFEKYKESIFPKGLQE
ncbi:MAG: Lrp/AsnC family transcriptional regulator [Nanoarchaeota archaeon]